MYIKEKERKKGIVMYFGLVKGNRNHITLAYKLHRSLCNRFDTDIICIDIYDYVRNRKRLHKLIVECNGKNIQVTKDRLYKELNLKATRLECFEKDNYRLIYECLGYEQIINLYSYVKLKKYKVNV